MSNSFHAGNGVSGNIKVDIDGDSYKGFWSFLILFMQGYRIDGEYVFHDEYAAFTQFTALAEGTYSSIVGVFNSVVIDLVDPDFYSKISVNPFEPPDNRLSVDDVINKGKIVVYEPGNITKASEAIGKTLKSLFFRRLLSKNRLNCDVMPFFYVCDEFQRFITFDEESGEQSFFDRCRAYNVCCAVATQSVASLRYVFSDKKGENSINILLNNTGTKLFFRTTDAGVSKILTDLIPAPVRIDRPHLVAARPPSTLQVGECYYVSAGGASGRGIVTI